MSLKIDLTFLTQGGLRQTNFTTKLLELILKADSLNRENLRKGFPNAVRTVEHYQRTGEILNLESD